MCRCRPFAFWRWLSLRGPVPVLGRPCGHLNVLCDQLAGCRAAIDRREKKLGLANVAVSKAVEERDAIEKDLAEHRAQLLKLEQEADRYKSMNVDDIETGGPEKQEMLQLKNDFLAAQHQNSALAAQMLQAQEFMRSLQRSQDLLTTERDALRLELSASAPVVSVLPAAPVDVQVVPAAPADVNLLVAQAVQASSQQMMAQFEGQIVALQSSLSYAFEARLAQLAECNASVPLEEAGQAAVRAQREPRGTDGTAPY